MAETNSTLAANDAITPDIRREVLIRDGHQCWSCGAHAHRWGIRWRAGTWTHERDTLAGVMKAAAEMFPDCHLNGVELWRRESVETCTLSGRITFVVLVVTHLDFNRENLRVPGNKGNLVPLCEHCNGNHEKNRHNEIADHAKVTRK